MVASHNLHDLSAEAVNNCLLSGLHDTYITHHTHTSHITHTHHTSHTHITHITHHTHTSHITHTHTTLTAYTPPLCVFSPPRQPLTSPVLPSYNTALQSAPPEHSKEPSGENRIALTNLECSYQIDIIIT